MSVRIWKLSIPFLAAGLVPIAASADDHAQVTAAQQDCIDKCLSDGSTASSATGVDAGAARAAEEMPQKKVKKAKKQKVSSSSSGTSSVDTTDPHVLTQEGVSKGTGVEGNLGAVTVYPDQATIDRIRAEERARAAEEFNADQQRAMTDNQAAIDAARMEARTEAERAGAEQLSAERMRYEQALADERAKGEKIGNALVTPAGVYGFLGGGATNFTQPEATGGTGTGGYWDARVGIGTRSVLGAEVGYVGSARDIAALGVGSDAFLMSNGIEGVARLNVPITPGEGKVLLEPYTFGGIGWNRYNVVSDTSLSASLSNEDDVLAVPLGVGMAFGFSGVTLDTRATYRQAIGSDLFGSETSSFGESSLNSWALGAALGFEF